MSFFFGYFRLFFELFLQLQITLSNHLAFRKARTLTSDLFYWKFGHVFHLMADPQVFEV